MYSQSVGHGELLQIIQILLGIWISKRKKTKKHRISALVEKKNWKFKCLSGLKVLIFMIQKFKCLKKVWMFIIFKLSVCMLVNECVCMLNVSLWMCYVCEYLYFCNFYHLSYLFSFYYHYFVLSHIVCFDVISSVSCKGKRCARCEEI